MTNIHIFQSTKGGVGCTTSACGFASRLAQQGKRVNLIATDDDAHAVVTTPHGNLTITVVEKTANTITVVEKTANAVEMAISKRSVDTDIVVVDAGFGLPNFERAKGWSRHLVVENHYLCLRRGVQASASSNYEDFVLLYDKESALSKGDCQLVLKLPMFFSVDKSDAIARSIDAGLFPRGEQVHFYEPEGVVV
jgi:cellulose biosynthesis protein BcsQ